MLGIALEHCHVEHERDFRERAELLTEIPTQKVKAGTLTRRLNACGLSLDTSHLGIARTDPVALTDWARRFELLAGTLFLVPRGQEVLVLLSNEKAGAVQPVLGAPLGLSNAVQGCPARSTPCGGPWHARTCDRQICPDRRSPALATPVHPGGAGYLPLYSGAGRGA
ncbi:hypothetical protein [Falsirhodobacter xinxiangensis]|uniref:hypothetical protein n=1 Tax=Falsirhodobacter xinxiangensis TaxID=2530049 RepID=UPI00145AF934|nr:hypothetical protein [Rhodobacter xinxiangensis]